ncbi:hypothetical protein EB234_09310 [Mesorhizobium japonicum R7A]|nr:hypothetical protein EB234_09310 [Mesorhizobium japonicum R7A]
MGTWTETYGSRLLEPQRLRKDWPATIQKQLGPFGFSRNWVRRFQKRYQMQL